MVFGRSCAAFARLDLPTSPMNGAAPPQNEQYLQWALTAADKTRARSLDVRQTEPGNRTEWQRRSSRRQPSSDVFTPLWHMALSKASCLSLAQQDSHYIIIYDHAVRAPPHVSALFTLQQIAARTLDMSFLN